MSVTRKTILRRINKKIKSKRKSLTSFNSELMLGEVGGFIDALEWVKKSDCLKGIKK